MIEKAIRSAFEKGDAEDKSFREKVYRSAFAALDRALQQNPNVTVEVAIRRRKALQAQITEIESEFIAAAPPAAPVPPAVTLERDAERPTDSSENIIRKNNDLERDHISTEGRAPNQAEAGAVSPVIEPETPSAAAAAPEIEVISPAATAPAEVEPVSPPVELPSSIAPEVAATDTGPVAAARPASNRRSTSGQRRRNRSPSNGGRMRKRPRSW